MFRKAQSLRRGSYGIDAPYAAAFMAFLVLVELALAILSRKTLPFVAFFFVLAIVASYFYATLRGKFLMWSGLLEELRLRGDERILDMGCGRGAVLLLAAGQLTTGRAIGVDLWRNVDQSGNSVEATRRNAIAEGVADRVELHTADMTALPLEDNSFDLVLSNVAIHNIRGIAGREKAIDEAVRAAPWRPAAGRRCPGHTPLPGPTHQARHERGHASQTGLEVLAVRPPGNHRRREGHETSQLPFGSHALNITVLPPCFNRFRRTVIRKPVVIRVLLSQE